MKSRQLLGYRYRKEKDWASHIITEVPLSNVLDQLTQWICTYSQTLKQLKTVHSGSSSASSFSQIFQSLCNNVTGTVNYNYLHPAVPFKLVWRELYIYELLIKIWHFWQFWSLELTGAQLIKINHLSSNDILRMSSKSRKKKDASLRPCQLIMIYLVWTTAAFEGSSTWTGKQWLYWSTVQKTLHNQQEFPG